MEIDEKKKQHTINNTNLSKNLKINAFIQLY